MVIGRSYSGIETWSYGFFIKTDDRKLYKIINIFNKKVARKK